MATVAISLFFVAFMQHSNVVDASCPTILHAEIGMKVPKQKVASLPFGCDVSNFSDNDFFYFIPVTFPRAVVENEAFTPETFRLSSHQNYGDEVNHFNPWCVTLKPAYGQFEKRTALLIVKANDDAIPDTVSIMGSLTLEGDATCEQHRILPLGQAPKMLDAMLYTRGKNDNHNQQLENSSCGDSTDHLIRIVFGAGVREVNRDLSGEGLFAPPNLLNLGSQTDLNRFGSDRYAAEKFVLKDIADNENSDGNKYDFMVSMIADVDGDNVVELCIKNRTWNRGYGKDDLTHVAMRCPEIDGDDANAPDSYRDHVISAYGVPCRRNEDNSLNWVEVVEAA